MKPTAEGIEVPSETKTSQSRGQSTLHHSSSDTTTPTLLTKGIWLKVSFIAMLSVRVFCLNSPSFPLRELGTFALFKLLALWWGTCLLKLKVIYLKFV